MAQFYVTLPSNASMDTYPNNTVTEYATKLPHPLELDGQWEVGLVEVTYPITWYNVERGECHFAIESDSGMKLGTIRLAEGRYETCRDIVNEIKRLVKKHVQRYYDARNETVNQPDIITIDLSEKTQKVVIQTSGCKLVLSQKLAELLGFERTHLPREDKYEAVSAADVNRGYNCLFVYCNVVVDSIVGDVRAPLLRSINVKGRYGDSIREIFVKPLYIPVRRNRFDTIEVSIKGENGRPVSFNSGRSCVTLHFKRANIALGF
jgi:hypothetical protein